MKPYSFILPGNRGKENDQPRFYRYGMISAFRKVARMVQELYEIWKHEGHQTWEIYTEVTEEFRMELCRNGWAFVFRSVETEAAEEVKTLPLQPRWRIMKAVCAEKPKRRS